MRRFVLVATLLLAAGAAFYFWPAGGFSNPQPNGMSSGPRGREAGAGVAVEAPGSGSASRPTSSAAAVTAPSNEADFPIATPLNAPGSSIARDLDIVRQLFETWQSNFPREGNPVGENADITAALMGDNHLGLALIPKGHRALNERGELCDRWGTPFRFHQLSGTRMEVRSAGPDRKFATEDDAIWTPQ